MAGDHCSHHKCARSIRIEDFTTGVSFPFVREVNLTQALENYAGSADYAESSKELTISTILERSDTGMGVARLLINNQGGGRLVLAVLDRRLGCANDRDANWGDAFSSIDGLGTGPIAIAPGDWGAFVYPLDLEKTRSDSICRATFYLSARDEKGEYREVRSIQVPIDVAHAEPIEVWRE